MGKDGTEAYLDICEKIDRLKVHETANDGSDEFGFSREGLKQSVKLAQFLYEKWFRVDLHGIENMPEDGPAIIVPNHSGQLPLDGMMISMACVTKMEQPRLPRAMIEKWFPTLPGVSTFLRQCGQVVGVTENAERLLQRGELLMIFPEGMRGSGKTWDKRYKLEKFAVGFLELAIRYNAKIVPTAVIGGEEQAPSFYDVKPLAKLLGFPYFPITPTFPWLGLLGFVPFPSKYHIYIGEPIDYSEYRTQVDDPAVIRGLVDSLNARIQGMVDEGLKARPFPGF